MTKVWIVTTDRDGEGGCDLHSAWTCPERASHAAGRVPGASVCEMVVDSLLNLLNKPIQGWDVGMERDGTVSWATMQDFANPIELSYVELGPPEEAKSGSDICIWRGPARNREEAIKKCDRKRKRELKKYDRKAGNT